MAKQIFTFLNRPILRKSLNRTLLEFQPLQLCSFTNSHNYKIKILVLLNNRHINSFKSSDSLIFFLRVVNSIHLRVCNSVCNNLLLLFTAGALQITDLVWTWVHPDHCIYWQFLIYKTQFAFIIVLLTSTAQWKQDMQFIFFSHLLIYKRIFSSLHISLSSWGLKASWKIHGDCDNWLIIYRLIACLKEFQEAWRPFANSGFSMFPLILLSLQILLCRWIKSQLTFCTFSQRPYFKLSRMYSPLLLWYMISNSQKSIWESSEIPYMLSFKSQGQ